MDTDLFDKVRSFVQKSFDDNKAQMLHFDRTVDWLKQLKPDACEAFLIAAIGHDIERAFSRDDKLGFDKNDRSFRDEEWLKYHSAKGAEILGEFLLKEQVGKEIINKVKHLISKHEVGGDEEQNLLKDADSLSFVENNAPIFLSKIDKLGYERVKEKFDWMHDRISSQRAKELAKPFYDKMMFELEKYK